MARTKVATYWSAELGRKVAALDKAARMAVAAPAPGPSWEARSEAAGAPPSGQPSAEKPRRAKGNAPL